MSGSSRGRSAKTHGPRAVARSRCLDGCRCFFVASYRCCHVYLVASVEHAPGGRCFLAQCISGLTRRPHTHHHADGSIRATERAYAAECMCRCESGDGFAVARNVVREPDGRSHASSTHGDLTRRRCSVAREEWPSASHDQFGIRVRIHTRVLHLERNASRRTEQLDYAARLFGIHASCGLRPYGVASIATESRG